MKQESPTRMSSRIKAMSSQDKANANAHDHDDANSTDTDSAHASSSAKAPPQYQCPANNMAGPGETKAQKVGVAPKLSQQKQSHPHASRPQPAGPPPPPYPGHKQNPVAAAIASTTSKPTTVRTTKSGRVLPPVNIPAPDPKTLEERKQKAYEYAMQDHPQGRGAGRGRMRCGGGGGSRKHQPSATKNANSNRLVTMNKQSARGETNISISAASATAFEELGVPSTFTLDGGGATTSVVQQQQQRRSNSSSMDALAEAAANATKSKSNTSTTLAVPTKRKVGRPKKIATTASNAAAAGGAKPTTTTTRKRGRPRKVPTYHPNNPQAKKKAQEQAEKVQRDESSRITTLAGQQQREQPTSASASSSSAVQRSQMDNSNNRVDVQIITQTSLPNSNATSDNDMTGLTTTTHHHHQTLASSSLNNNNVTSYNPLPMKRSSTTADASSVYDDEYARFMRSIIGDDQSVLTFRTLQSIRTSGGGRAEVGSVVGSAFETLDEDDVSYQLTSDEEDDDDDDDLCEEEEEEEEDVTMKEVGEVQQQHAASPRKQSAAAAIGTISAAAGGGVEASLAPHTPMILPHLEETYDEDLMNVFGEIEGLMEEDLEAAVMASLIGGPALSGEGDLSSNHAWSNKPGANAPSSAAAAAAGTGMMGFRGPHAATGAPGARATPGSIMRSSNQGAIMGSQQQKAITTPGFSTKKQKSTTTVVTTPSPCMGKDRLAAAAAAGNNKKVVEEVPAVTKDQLARLRNIMARHHQLLLQQAALSVRAAYVQKVRKDGVSAASSSSQWSTSPMNRTTTTTTTVPGKKMNTSLPQSRLDTRSLTFCPRPTDESKCSYANDFYGGESPEELSECLDGAVGMLQDLEQNWKDAVRNSIQLSFQPSTQQLAQQSGCRNLNFGESNGASNMATSNNGPSETLDRRLTRSAFTRTLLERELEMGNSSSSHGGSLSSPKKAQHHSPSSPDQQSHNNHPLSRVSVFEVRGLGRLKETFSALDNSVKDIQMGREKGKNKDGINILAPDQHGRACEILLKHARAEIDNEYVPGVSKSDLGACLTHAPEAFDNPHQVDHPLTKKQEAELRRNRHAFTSGEDNLILRGVNLYGEKEWCLVSDRFLPDRVVNSISQRYNKLCFMIYRANGIAIDEKGKLPPIPTFPKGAIYDMTKVAQIRPTRAPTTMNVHRWSLEEDVAILKAVPVMGNAWAEICTKLMPHRDRGHIRKRFQVLQRRIPKGVTKMNMKYLLKRLAPMPMARAPPTKRLRSSYKKKAPAAKKKASTKTSKLLPATAPITARASAAGKAPPVRSASTGPASAPVVRRVPQSPAKIFEQAAARLRPPMSPIKSTPGARPSSPVKRDFSTLAAAAASVEAVDAGGEASPETRVMASVLGDFSRHHEESTRMGVEKILGNDDLSNASGLERLIEAGTAESNFMPDQRYRVAEVQSPPKPSEQLPAYHVDNGEASGLSVINGDPDDTEEAAQGTHHGEQRKSILSSIMEKTKENELKRKSSTAFPPSTPQKHGFSSSQKMEASPIQADIQPIQEECYPSSIPTSMFSSMGTPARGEGMGMLGAAAAEAGKGDLSLHPGFFEYFMNDKSGTSAAPTTPGRPANTTNAMSSTSKSTGMTMSPIKLGNMTHDEAPLTQFGTLAGQVAGLGDGFGHSLLMGASDFDAAAALKDLSNSAPNTPSKLLRPRGHESLAQGAVPYSQDYTNDEAKEAGEEQASRKKPRTSLFGRVKAKVDGRKSG